MYEQIGIDNLFGFKKYADYSREVVDMVLSEAEKMAVDVLAPTLEKGDKEGAQFRNGKAYAPACLHEPFKTFSEAGAGSDVGALRTTARRLPDGRFSITGTKCFISAGDHDMTENIVHPVLARIEGDPPGTKGISIFIVPKIRVNDDGSLGEPNDVITGNLEHKMGIKGAATATLNFGENGNCIGELLGEEQAGMKIMFRMMNEARLDVGMQGQSIASAAYEHAVQYAKERVQSRSALGGRDSDAVTIINHPPVRRPSRSRMPSRSWRLWAM